MFGFIRISCVSYVSISVQQNNGRWFRVGAFLEIRFWNESSEETVRTSLIHERVRVWRLLCTTNQREFVSIANRNSLQLPDTHTYEYILRILRDIYIQTKRL